MIILHKIGEKRVHVLIVRAAHGLFFYPNVGLNLIMQNW